MPNTTPTDYNDPKVGYIVVIDYHYDCSAQAEDPSIIYTDRAEADAAAAKLDGNAQSGLVWEVRLP